MDSKYENEIILILESLARARGKRIVKYNAALERIVKVGSHLSKSDVIEMAQEALDSDKPPEPEQCCGTCLECEPQKDSEEWGHCMFFLQRLSHRIKTINVPNWAFTAGRGKIVSLKESGKDCKCWKEKD